MYYLIIRSFAQTNVYMNVRGLYHFKSPFAFTIMIMLTVTLLLFVRKRRETSKFFGRSSLRIINISPCSTIATKFLPQDWSSPNVHSSQTKLRKSLYEF